jgi:integrase
MTPGEIDAHTMVLRCLALLLAQGDRVERLRLGSIWQDFDLVLPGPDGRPQYRQALYREFRQVVSRAGIESPETVNWHGLRHTAASLWIKAGVDIFTVSRRLGHGSASFSMDQYGHLLRGQQRAAAEALDHLLA